MNVGSEPNSHVNVSLSMVGGFQRLVPYTTMQAFLSKFTSDNRDKAGKLLTVAIIANNTTVLYIF